MQEDGPEDDDVAVREEDEGTNPHSRTDPADEKGGEHGVPKMFAPGAQDTGALILRFPLPPTKIHDGRLFRKIG
jgi:hypothetical protein